MFLFYPLVLLLLFPMILLLLLLLMVFFSYLPHGRDEELNEFFLIIYELKGLRYFNT